MLCGIDEAGRGCIAGDLVVAGVIFQKADDSFEALTDSKKLSEKKRELLFEELTQNTTFHIVVKSPQEIDEKGISLCMQEALTEILTTLKANKYLFDGNTNFKVEQLETMVKADASVAEVSAASILAKVTHDRNIKKEAQNYPDYSFEKHKGYGTKAHIETIKLHGYTPVHRRSYKVKGLENFNF